MLSRSCLLPAFSRAKAMLPAHSASVSLCAPGGASCRCPCITSQQPPRLGPRGPGWAKHRLSGTAPALPPPSRQSPPCAGSRAGGERATPGVPALTQGRAEELAAPGPVGKAFFFSSSIKHFPSLEPQGGFGWEATWPRRCRPRDASWGGGMSPWPWAGSPPRSPSAACGVLPGPQQRRCILPLLQPGLVGAVPQFPHLQKGSAGGRWGHPGEASELQLPHPEGDGQRLHLGKLRHLEDPSESAGRQRVAPGAPTTGSPSPAPSRLLHPPLLAVPLLDTIPRASLPLPRTPGVLLPSLGCI